MTPAHRSPPLPRGLRSDRSLPGTRRARPLYTLVAPLLPALLLAAGCDDPSPTELRPAATIEGAPADEIGSDLASAGDVNADGYDDVLIISRYSTANGEVSLFHGPLSGAIPTTEAGARILPDTLTIGDDSFLPVLGNVSSAGDFNGDGYDDVMVSSVESRSMSCVGDCLYFPGVVYVFFGPLEGDRLASEANLTLVGEPGANAGVSTRAAGDLNGDGNGDLIVGGLETTAYVVYGPRTGELHLAGADARIVTGSDNSLYAFVAPGDVSGDGYADVLVTDSRQNWHLFYGPLEGDVPLENADRVLQPESAPDSLDTAAGDFNGDGHIDLVTTAWSGDYLLFFREAAMTAEIYLGPLTALEGPILPDVEIEVNAGVSWFEHVSLYVSQAPAGDMDGDGSDDLAIFVDLQTEERRDRTVAVFSGPLEGSYSFDEADAVVVTGGGSPSRVAGAGDVNGDGLADLLVSGTESGVVWLVQGTR